MTIVGFEIISCPFCTRLYKNRIIGSLNTLNSRYFSDGHLDGKWVPKMPSIIKCVNKDCRKFFYIEDAKVIAKLDKNSFDTPEWKDAHYLAERIIGAKELEKALTTDFCKNEEETIMVRTLLLRRYNDVFRDDRNYKFSATEKEAFLKNIEKLIELYKNENTTDGKLFLAELYREAGNFDFCLKILKEIKGENEDETLIKEKIYSQAKIKDDKVFNVYEAATKKEYRCNNCGDNMIVFDLEKLNSSLEYRHYRCKNENKIVNAPSKIRNPDKYYSLTLAQKLFKTKAPYQECIRNENIVCPGCNGTDMEIFNPEKQKCIKCHQGNYETVKWF